MSRAQLALGLRLDQGISFDSYLPGEVNAVALEVLRNARESVLYLCGVEAVGKSHLLQAAVHDALQRGESACYLPLRELLAYEAEEVLAGLESQDVLAVDDIDAIAGNAEWEHQLFHLFNALRDAGGRWIASGRVPVAELPLALADLRSRLGWGPSLQLRMLSDDEKLASMQQRARQSGLELPEDVGLYLINRCGRDLPTLLQTLDRLDHASLVAQRRLTIPFVRDALQLS